LIVCLFAAAVSADPLRMNSYRKNMDFSTLRSSDLAKKVARTNVLSNIHGKDPMKMMERVGAPVALVAEIPFIEAYVEPLEQEIDTLPI